MEYEVHITRRAEWFDDDGPSISLEEWLDYVSSDPEMRHDGYAEAETPSGTLRTEEEGIAVWVAYPRHGKDGNAAWFSHFRDRISVKNPDQSILVKMHDIAAKLDARVQGDEGEEYGPDGHPRGDDAPTTRRRETPWWKFW